MQARTSANPGRATVERIAATSGLGIRPERQMIERQNYSLPDHWFVGLSPNDWSESNEPQ
jgi:hypothetical protein